AVAVPVAVFVRVVRQLIEARVIHPRRAGGDAIIESGQGDDLVDGRARRVESAHDPVEQRLVDGVAQLTVVRMADPGHEQVGVEGRLTDIGQYTYGLGLDGDHSAPAVAQRLFGHGLQATVQMQSQIATGFRLGALEHPHYPA